MIYDYLLTWFVSGDDYRPQLCKPWVEGEHVCATDAHAFIQIDKKMVALQEKYQIDEAPAEDGFKPKPPPSIQKLLADKVFGESLTIEIEKLIEGLAQIEFRFEELPCEVCEGKGTITCKCCDNDSDCRECDGSGDSGTPVNRKIYDEGALIKIDEMYFNPKFIERLVIVSKMLGENRIRINIASPVELGLFTITPHVTVGIMPIVAGFSEKKIFNATPETVKS